MIHKVTLTGILGYACGHLVWAAIYSVLFWRLDWWRFLLAAFFALVIYQIGFHNARMYDKSKEGV